MKVVLSVWILSLGWALAIGPTCPASGGAATGEVGFDEASSNAGRTRNGQSTDLPRKAISGTVVDQSGQPLVNAAVYLSGAGAPTGSNRNEWTDDDGKFQFTGLYPGVFIVFVRVPTHYMDLTDDKPAYVRPGESIKIRMIRGGVITGKVTGPSGEPLIAASVKPIRVRDQDGKPPVAFTGYREFQTDDRGLYRIYGLAPGAYVVAVGGGRTYGQQKPYDLNAPTYYPSSTRDTASEVMVSAGQEAAGIDIRYRDETGFRISGTVAGVPPTQGNFYTGVSILLAGAKNGLVESSAYVQRNDPNSAFVFYGVPDGEYELTARRANGREEGLASTPHRVSVKGSDVKGLQLTLAPLARISGQIVVDPIPEGLKKDEVRATDAALAEVLIKLRREGKTVLGLASAVEAAPDEKGSFVLKDLVSDTYRFELDLPSEDWYVREISSSKTAKPAQRPAGRTGTASNGSDIAARGLTVKGAEHIDAVSIAIGRGAGFVGGAVTSGTESAPMPARLGVCLVPVEAERATDALYYRQALIAADGKFAFANVAPGKYRIVVVPGPADDSPESRRAQIAWDPGARKQLRQRADSDGLELELPPRARIKDFVLHYKPVGSLSH